MLPRIPQTQKTQQNGSAGAQPDVAPAQARGRQADDCYHRYSVRDNLALTAAREYAPNAWRRCVVMQTRANAAVVVYGPLGRRAPSGRLGNTCVWMRLVSRWPSPGFRSGRWLMASRGLPSRMWTP